MHCRHKSRTAIIKDPEFNQVCTYGNYQQQYPYTTKCNGEHSYIWYIPYYLKLRPVSYKRWILISALGIARYNIRNKMHSIALHASSASIRIHCYHHRL